MKKLLYICLLFTVADTSVGAAADEGKSTPITFRGGFLRVEGGRLAVEDETKTIIVARPAELASKTVPAAAKAVPANNRTMRDRLWGKPRRVAPQPVMPSDKPSIPAAAATRGDLTIAAKSSSNESGVEDLISDIQSEAAASATSDPSTPAAAKKLVISDTEKTATAASASSAKAPSSQRRKFLSKGLISNHHTVESEDD